MGLRDGRGREKRNTLIKVALAAIVWLFSQLTSDLPFPPSPFWGGGKGGGAHQDARAPSPYPSHHQVPGLIENDSCSLLHLASRAPSSPFPHATHDATQSLPFLV